MSDVYTMLILAVMPMRNGLYVAGMTDTPDPITHLRWIRPVNPYMYLLPDDIRYECPANHKEDGHLIANSNHARIRPATESIMRPGDIVHWRLGAGPAIAPYVEDTLVDPLHPQAQFVRRSHPFQLARFCARHLDKAPDDVLIHKTRSLCLVRPDSICAVWCHDSTSGQYEARMLLQIGAFVTHGHGIPVNDPVWRALGRRWLDGRTWFEQSDTTLRERFGTIYLVIGRERTPDGRSTLSVVGVRAANIQR